MQPTHRGHHRRIRVVGGEVLDGAAGTAVRRPHPPPGIDEPPPRLLVQPPPRMAGRLVPLVPNDHADGRVDVGGTQRLDSQRCFGGRRLQELPQIRVQVDQIQQCGGLRTRVGTLEPGEVLITRPLMQRGVLLRVPPAQVGGECVAGQIVQVQPERPGIDERQLPHPVEQLAAVRLVQQGGEHRLVEHPDLRGGLQGDAVRPARNGRQQPRDQHRDDVLRISGGQHALLPDHLADQRQRQRMAVGELDRRGVQRLRHALAGQQRAGVIRTQIGQPHRPNQRRPARIGSPTRSRRQLPTEHQQRAARQAGRPLVADPSVELGEQFVVVQQDHRATGEAGGSAEGGRDGLGDRREVPGVDRQGECAGGSVASAANRCSSVVFPTPAGPVTNSTAGGQSGAASNASNTASSDRRPTDPRRRPSATRSAIV